MGWIYAFPKLYEPEIFLESYSSVVSLDKISTLQLHQKREVKWKIMHGRSGSRPWAFAFMPMDPMWNLSWKLLAILLISWIILPVSLNLIPRNYGFGHIDIPWFLFSNKLKYLSFAYQYTCQPSMLLYLRVLPSGISIISPNHAAYYEPSSNIIPHWFQCFLVPSC